MMGDQLLGHCASVRKWRLNGPFVKIQKDGALAITFPLVTSCPNVFDVAVMAYEGRSLWDFGIDRSWLERYVLDYACEDVLAYHIAVSPIAMFYASNLDVPNPERFPETRFYREWVVAQGLAYAAGGIVMREGEWMTEIYLQRSPLQPPFSRAELAQLDPLIPHLQRALQMRQRFIDLQLGGHLFASMLDVLVIPAMLFDENGCLVRANARASEE